MIGSERQQKRALAARVRQVNTVMTTGSLAAVASALWKPLIEGSAPFTGRNLLTLGIATLVLCITVGLAPYGEHNG